MLPNLNMILVNNFYFNPYKFGYKKCQNLNCKTCEFSLNFSFIKMSKKMFFPIISNSSCISVNYIYIILCLFCKNTFYIG